MLDAEPGRAAEAQILADRADRILDGVGDRFVGAGILGVRDRLGLAAERQRDLGDVAHDLLEGLVAGDEVGLGIDLDHHRLAQAGIDTDQAFGRRAAGLLVGLGDALLAQPVDRGLHVAVGFGEGGLAVHHARAGQLAEFLDLCS